MERLQTLIITGAIEPEQPDAVRPFFCRGFINQSRIRFRKLFCPGAGGIYFPCKGQVNCVSGNSELESGRNRKPFVSLEGLVKKGKELDVKREIFPQKAEEYF